MTERHLISDLRCSSPVEGTVAVFCGGSKDFTPMDRAQHTFLRAMATCSACLASHEAQLIVDEAADREETVDG